MHEMALAESVVQIIEDYARRDGFARVRTVWLEIGSLSGVETEAMRFCFDAASRATPAEGARLEILELPGTAWCMRCSERTIDFNPRHEILDRAGRQRKAVDRLINQGAVRHQQVPVFIRLRQFVRGGCGFDAGPQARIVGHAVDLLAEHIGGRLHPADRIDVFLFGF